MCFLPKLLIICILTLVSHATEPDWQSTVDEMSSSVNMLAGWIVAQNGTILATSSDPLFLFENKEAKGITNVMSGPYAYRAIITVGGVTYQVYAVGEHTLYGKRSKWGVVCQKTNQTILVGVFRAWDSGDTLTSVRDTAKLLIAEGY